LISEIGGANDRFAVFDEAANPTAPQTLRTEDYANLSEAISACLAGQALDGEGWHISIDVRTQCEFAVCQHVILICKLA